MLQLSLLFDAVQSPSAIVPAASAKATGPRLRPYQVEAIAAIERCLATSASTLLVLPTGTGKTIVFSEVARRWPGQVMVLAHRRELLDQAANKLEHATGERTALEQGDNRAFPQSRLIVASKDSLHPKRLERFKDVSLLIVDEAHRAGTKKNLSYYSVINHLRECNPNLKLLGVTATPNRHDGEAMGQVFETVAYQYSIHDAISDGYLVPMSSRVVQIDGLDLTSVRTTAGDLNGKDLAAVLERDELLLAYADAIIRESAGRQHVLVFCASVAQAQALATMIEHHGQGRVEFVCGDPKLTSQEKRIAVSRDFRDGKIRFVVNCGIYLEGFDAPLTDLVAMARPTKSLSLYTQMVGRGSRPAPGVVDPFDLAEERRAAIAASVKPDCLILDFVGNSHRHKIVSAVDVLGGKYPEDVCELAKANIKKGGRQADIDEELEKAAAEIAKRNEQAERRKAKLIAKAKYRASNVDMFDASTRGGGEFRNSKPSRAVMPFGKHKGKQLSTLHTMYLQVLWEKCTLKTDWLRNAVSDEIMRRGGTLRVGANTVQLPAARTDEAPAGQQPWRANTSVNRFANDEAEVPF